MVTNSVSLNKKFREVIRGVDGTEVTRKDLVELSRQTYELSEKQAQGFVGRNVYKLQKQGLLLSKENSRGTYSISSHLQELLHCMESDDERPSTQENQSTFCLQQEESKAGAELQMLVAEIEAYQELVSKYPSRLEVINQLLCEARARSTALYGKLNAVKKVIRLTEQESGGLC